MLKTIAIVVGILTVAGCTSEPDPLYANPGETGRLDGRVESVQSCGFCVLDGTRFALGADERIRIMGEAEVRGAVVSTLPAGVVEVTPDGDAALDPTTGLTAHNFRLRALAPGDAHIEFRDAGGALIDRFLAKVREPVALQARWTLLTSFGPLQDTGMVPQLDRPEQRLVVSFIPTDREGISLAMSNIAVTIQDPAVATMTNRITGAPETSTSAGGVVTVIPAAPGQTALTATTTSGLTTTQALVVR